VTLPPWSGLLAAWFGGTEKDPSAIKARMGWWFSADAERDASLARDFGELAQRCANGDTCRWRESPEGRLALVIALDQLPRNLFRGTPRAFAGDSDALALCLAAVHTGQDRALKPVQRAFLYLPLQHSEDLQGQETGVRLFSELARENGEWPVFREGFLDHAKLHRDIIARFGRFPHRNRILGRRSTPEEAVYLEGDPPRFGQEVTRAATPGAKARP
jgi:uncharacterized protein (DUF924 family)